jgi:predicted kinase
MLTGGPAAGKSTTGRLVAQTRSCAALIDVDDVRQLIVSGGAAPWEGDEGRRQQHLGVENACGLARRFLEAAVDVVIADVLTRETAEIYRTLLPNVVIVHLRVSLAEARRRAAMRPTFISESEFMTLHRSDQEFPPAAHHRLDVDGLNPSAQAEAVTRLWPPDA